MKRDDIEEGITDITLRRLEESVELLQDNRPSEQFNPYFTHSQHVEELEQQAVAMLADSIEAVGEEKEYATARRLANAADTQLSSIQDLAVDKDPDVADEVGVVREKIKQAKGVLGILKERYS